MTDIHFQTTHLYPSLHFLKPHLHQPGPVSGDFASVFHSFLEQPWIKKEKNSKGTREKCIMVPQEKYKTKLLY